MNYDILICFSPEGNTDQVELFINDLRRKIIQIVGKDESKTHPLFSIGLSVDIEEDDTQRYVKISELVEDARVLIALLSPSFFYSENSKEILRLFYQKEDKQRLNLVFPVFIEECVTGSTTNSDSSFDIRNELSGDDYNLAEKAINSSSLSIQRWYEIRTDEDVLEEAYAHLVYAINNTLRKISPRSKGLNNWHIINTEIDKEINDYGTQYDSIRDILSREMRVFPSRKPICVIYTGGTVGMVRKEKYNRHSELVIGAISEVISYIPKLKELEFDIDFYSYAQPLDSSNITSRDWVVLAEIIEKLYGYYQGFVILHGANTMAYTASALSFMFENLSKPIILTGAEIPLIELYSDAEQNILRAIRTAAFSMGEESSQLPEVCILYGNSLLRGNRATKKKALSTTDGFFSPNYDELGTVSHEQIGLNYRSLRDAEISGSEKLKVEKNIVNNKIAIFDVYPDMDIHAFRSICQIKDLNGIILRTYGTGNAPESQEFLDELENLIHKKNVIVVNLTQCTIGRVELRLFETNARLFDIGVISGGDMTTEAAYCKMKYLFGLYSASKDWEELRKNLQINLRGELTDSTYSIKYEKRNKDDNTLVNEVFHGKAKPKPRFDKKSINNAVFRLQGIHVLKFGSSNGKLGIDVDTETLEIDVFLNGTFIASDKTFSASNLIGSFKQKLIHTDKGAYKEISFNLDVKEKVKQLLQMDNREGMSIQLVSPHAKFEFDSMQLIICTTRI